MNLPFPAQIQGLIMLNLMMLQRPGRSFYGVVDDGLMEEGRAIPQFASARCRKCTLGVIWAEMDRWNQGSTARKIMEI